MTEREGAWQGHPLTRGAAIVAALVAVTVLMSSLLGDETLTTVVPSGTRMAPITAFAFLLSAIALGLTGERWLPLLARSCALVVLTIGTLQLAAYAFGWSMQAAGMPATGMPAATAFNFIFLGAALALAHRPTAALLSQALAVVVLTVGAVGLSQYIYGIGQLVPHVTMAVHSALLFLVLGVGVISIHRDAEFMARANAQRRQAQAELRASGAQLRTLAESLPNLVWTARPNGSCDYLSRQWVEYTGRPEAEQLGSGWVEALHPEDRMHACKEWTLAVARGDAFDVEYRIRRADGAYRWFRTRAIPMRNATGAIEKWFGSTTDIEDYKLSEQKLRTRLNRLALLDRTTRAIADRQDLQSILDVVLRSLEESMPVDFGCVCLNDAGRATLSVACVGTRSQALAAQVGMTEHTVIEEDEDKVSRCAHGEFVLVHDMSQETFPLAVKLQSADLGSLVLAPLNVEGTVFGILVAARRGEQQFNAEDGEFLRQLSAHVALVMHQADLHGALQRAYDDLRETQQKVMQQERLRALGQMATGIAHDINNALSPAALYAQVLMRHDGALSSDEAKGYITIIHRAIEDVASTVTRMKEFCRPREQQLAQAPVNLNQIVEQVLALTHARWHDMPQERGVVVQLKTDFGADLPPVMGAETELRDGVTNLVLNAVDAMPEGGTLTVRTRRLAGSHVGVEVGDTGIGMDEDTRSRCLEPFFTTKGERGTGLGLAMVYGMLERHDGDIQIDSEPGRGTTMRLIFPAQVSAAAQNVTLGMALRSLQPLRLLLIDDDPMVLKSLHQVLLQEGHWVTTADGGEAGIDVFRSAEARGIPFSAVITDLGMPHVDGRKVAAAVKDASPLVPVLLLTGWGHRMIAEGETPEFVDRVLAKPPKMVELRQALVDLTSGTPHLADAGTTKKMAAPRLYGSGGLQ